MSKDTTRQITNIFAVVLALAVNIIATTLPLNNQSTAEISDRFLVYFVPAGYVFSIWGIIYLGWIAFAIYQARPAQKQIDSSLVSNNAWVATILVLILAIYSIIQRRRKLA